MEMQTIGEIAKALPSFSPGEKNEERREFFRKVVDWVGYSNIEEYPFSSETEKILETVLKIDGQDKAECLIEILSTISFSHGLRETALKEIDDIVEKGSFDGSERERLKRKVFELRKKTL
ncbi:MAG: hypothetical protein V1717_00570 [Candidatus Micrarchaeota archaeon]